MEKILCYSCNKSKHKLNAKKSALLPINLLMCETCISSKLEPRWVVILAGRSNGPDHVRDLLVDIAQYPEFLAIRLYEDNFLQFHGTRKEIVIDRVMKIKSMIESYGVRCELEGKPSERVL